MPHFDGGALAGASRYSGGHAISITSCPAAMNPVGDLSVVARYGGGVLSGLEVVLERPPVARLFLGQSPGAVARLVPCLYTLCAQAQAAAARAALAAAGDGAAPPAAAAPLWAEALHEHLWRLLLDWPLALGLPQAKDAFVAWRAARGGGQLAAATRSLLESTLLGVPLAAWLEGRPPAGPSLAAQCLARLEKAEMTPVLDLPALTPANWLAYWRGSPAGQPPVPRPASIAAAWQSRLREVVAAALALERGEPYPVVAVGGAGWGVGQTRTARGILTHGVRLEDGRVAAYRVWAPTDCHFADATGLSALLADGCWPDRPAAQRAVEQAVLALDPCLPYTVRVEDA